MMSFFVGFAFFELGVFCGFFAASLMQAARTGEIVITVKEDRRLAVRLVQAIPLKTRWPSFTTMTASSWGCR